MRDCLFMQKNSISIHAFSLQEYCDRRLWKGEEKMSNFWQNIFYSIQTQLEIFAFYGHCQSLNSVEEGKEKWPRSWGHRWSRKGNGRSTQLRFFLCFLGHMMRVALLHHTFLETMEGKPLEPGAKVCCLNSLAFAHSNDSLTNSVLPSGILKRGKVRNVLRSSVNVNDLCQYWGWAQHLGRDEQVINCIPGYISPSTFLCGDRASYVYQAVFELPTTRPR